MDARPIAAELLAAAFGLTVLVTVSPASAEETEVPTAPAVGPVVLWRRQLIPPSPRFVGSHWNFGVGMGLTLPDGTVQGQLFAAYEPVPWFAFEGHGTLGGPFGDGVGARVRLMTPPLFGMMRLGLGVGYSADFLSRDPSDPERSFPGAPGVAHFLDFDLMQEYAFGSHFTMRLGARVSVLLNAQSYAGMCQAGGCSADSNAFSWTFDGGPWTAAGGTTVYTGLEWGVAWAI